MLFDVQVLGLSGKARSGKDYLAKNVVVPMGFLPVALADHFKISAAAKGVLSDGTRFEADLPQLWETDKDETHRRAFQEEGTENGRLKYGEDIWTRHLEMWLYKFSLYGIRRFVVTDIRFPNEVEWVQSLGGKVYRIEGRGGLKGGEAQHPSETALDGYRGFDRFINNSELVQDSTPHRLTRSINIDFEEARDVRGIPA